MLILACDYIILFTANPNVVNLALPGLPAPAQTFTPGGPNVGVFGKPGGLSGAQAMKGFVSGITLKPGASVDGMKASTVQAIDYLELDCAAKSGGSCAVNITSGTDSHAAGTGHAVGNKADFQPNQNLDSYITSFGTKAYVRSDGAQIYAVPGVGLIADERSKPTNCGTRCGWSGPHWDMTGPGN
jgi:hypothetical protein